MFASPKLVPIRAEVHVAERPIRVMTRRGPRTSLKRYEFADGVRLRFRLKLLDDGVVEEQHLRRILDYLQESGLGRIALNVPPGLLCRGPTTRMSS